MCFGEKQEERNKKSGICLLPPRDFAALLLLSLSREVQLLLSQTSSPRTSILILILILRESAESPIPGISMSNHSQIFTGEGANEMPAFKIR